MELGKVNQHLNCFLILKNITRLPEKSYSMNIGFQNNDNNSQYQMFQLWESYNFFFGGGIIFTNLIF